MGALITPAQLSEALPELKVEDLAGLPAIVTSLAEGFCGRPLVARHRTEEHKPDRHGRIRLLAYPILAIERLAASPLQVLRIQAEPAEGLWSATVRFLFEGPDPAIASGIALARLVDGVEEIEVLPFDPEDGTPLATAGALVEAVAAVPGWTAVLTNGQAYCPTARLRTFRWQASAITSVGLVAFSRPVFPAEIEEMTGRVEVGGVGRVWSFGGPLGIDPATVQVRYLAGYNADPEVGPVNVPGDLQEACRLIGRALVDHRKQSGVVKQVSLGNTGYTLAEQTAALSPVVRGILSRYREEL